MKKGATSLKMLFFLLLPLLTTAQIQVSFPVSRAVFQRSLANTATIRITGFYTTTIARIQARMVAVQPDQGTTTDWVVIQNNVSGGVFAGDITAKGGWYNLQVQGLDENNTAVGDIQTVNFVGVGEVFVVAGQSNAQGIRKNVPPSNDQRVNCVQYLGPILVPGQDLPFPEFRHLDADVDMGPNGVGAWCWGLLGDLLAARLNVPILFMNAALAGTSSRNWLESAQNGITNSEYLATNTLAIGQPYLNLQAALRDYANILGVRAVLWHQGETDNFAATSTAQYAYNLSYVINRSRQDCGKNLPWVIARASYDDFRKSSPNVLAGQNQVIATVGNAFAGPNTDVIEIPRSAGGDDTHFSNNGLVTVASAWNASLTDAFFANAVPQALAPAPTMTVACAGNQLILTVNGSPASVNWSSGEVGPSITKGQGTYSAKVKDGFGNIHYTSPVQVSAAPFIQVNGATTFCQGGSVSLTTNYQTNITWNTGQTTRTITPTTQGNYVARYRDVSGCNFTTETINVVVNPVPDAPTITPSGSTTFCQRESVVLTSSPARIYNWSTGETARTITASATGNYALTVTNEFGCTSPTSAVVTTQANPLPTTPVVTASGPTTFCANQKVTLTSTPDVAYVWASGQTSQALTIDQSGDFLLRTRNAFGCLSDPSNKIAVQVNPLPPTPVVTASGPTTFCADQSVTLTSTPEATYNWISGQNSQAITTNQSGDFSLRTTNVFGCSSAPSNKITVRVNPLPISPVVTANGPTTFCADQSVTLISTQDAAYAWTSGQTSQTVTTNQSGDFALRTRNIFGCLSELSNKIAVKVNPLPPVPTLVANGRTTFCDGDNVTLTVITNFKPIWTTGDSTKIITATKSGNYTAKVVDQNGCFSPTASAIMISVKAVPTTPSVIQIGTYTLQAVGSLSGDAYFWRRGSDSLSARSATIKANQSGNYTVRASITYSPDLVCYSASSAPLAFVADTENGGLSIYPNPSPDKNLTLETLQNLTNATIRIYTLTGQEVFTTIVPLFDERKKLELMNLASGPYIIQVSSADFLLAKRILIGL